MLPLLKPNALRIAKTKWNLSAIGLNNFLIFQPNLGISSTSVTQMNGIITCSFTRSNTGNSDTKYYDLKTNYYLFFGIGPICKYCTKITVLI